MFFQWSYATNNLLTTDHIDDEFHFTFSANLLQKDINHFKLLENTNNRYIFNIEAIKSPNVKTPKNNELKNIRIAQFDKKNIRIVFESEKELDLKYRLDGKKLIVKIDNLINKNILQTVSNKSIKNDIQPQIANQNSENKKKIIAIDPGHGGKDPGTVYERKKEKDAVLKVALFLGEELKKRGYKVVFTRDKDSYLQLRDRTKIANDKNTDLFISIHVNAAAKKAQYNSWEGIETYFLSPARSDRSISVAELENKSDIEEMNYYSKQTFLNFLNREKIIASHKLAIDIQSFALSSIKSKYSKAVDGGVREAPFWVLVGAQMPAVLVEIGYITNPTERERIFSDTYQKLLAVGLANGIEAYFEKNK